MPDTPHITTLTRDFDPGAIADVYARNADAGAFAFGVPDAPALERFRVADDARVILAEYSKTVIGVAVLTFPAAPEETKIVPWFSREDLAVLSRVVVEDDLRTLGVASQLIACAERTAANMGAQQIGCACLAGNDEFINALVRRGYQHVARTDHGGHRLVALRKPIGAQASAAA